MKVEYHVEQTLSSSDSIVYCLKAMKQYRNWSDSTFEAYLHDVHEYERFLISIQKSPVLNESKLNVVHCWIKSQQEEGIAVATIRRRIAALSSIYEFCKALGIVHSNPFKAISAPAGETGYHSVVMSFEQLKEAYRYVDVLEAGGYPVGLTVKVMLLTGLHNEALIHLKAQDVLVEEQLLRYDSGIVNSKHKVQFFPMPPRLFQSIREHIHKYDLQPDDQLLLGLSGRALQNKQLNRITNKICEGLGWRGESRITPHGFRSTIATILDERGVDIPSIKYLLGHSNKETIYLYLRRDNHKIQKLRKALTMLEAELEQAKEKRPELQKEEKIGEDSTSSILQISEEELLTLTKTYPEVALTLLQKGLLKKAASTI